MANLPKTIALLPLRNTLYGAVTKWHEECPVRSDNRHFYRPKASVWSHAIEFFARSAVKDGFRNLICNPQNINMQKNPHISKVSYPDVLVASAKYEDGVLRAVLYPNGQSTKQKIEIAGLIANKTYSCCGAEEQTIVADKDGNALVNIQLAGRTEIRILESV